MAFFTQLWLLTWKNLTLRRRQKIRLLSELIWPVLLFAIVAVVRQNQMPISIDECHFLGKALPSGGLLPFFQSFMCDFESKCQPNETYGEGSGNVNNFRDAGLTRLLEDIEIIMTNRTVLEAVKTLLIQVSELNKLLPYLKNLDKFPNAESKSLMDYLKDPDKVKRFLTEDLQLSPAVADAILNAKMTPEQVLSLLNTETFQDVSCDKEELQKLFGVENQTTLDTMQRELCNLTADDLASLSKMLAGQVDIDKLISLSALRAGGIPGRVGNGGGIQQYTGIPVEDLLLNKTALIDFLQEEYGVSEQDAELLVDSIDNPKILLLLLQGRNMRDTVCNTTLLDDYVTTTDPDQIEEMSETLCNLTDIDLDRLSREVQSVINYPALWKALNGTDVNEWYKNSLTLLISLARKISQLDSFNELVDEINLLFYDNNTNELICGSVGELINFNNISFGGAGADKGFGNFGDLKRLSSGMQSLMDGSARRGRRSTDDLQAPEEDCDWVQQIASTEIGEIMWDRIKPMIQGFILYTPDTKATRRIMKEAEQPFASMRLFRDLLLKWRQYSPLLRQFIETNPALDVVNQFQENPDLIPQLEKLLQTNSTPDFLWLKKVLLDAENDKRENNITDSWLAAIDAIDEFANSTLEILKCVNLDKVRGFDTEDEFKEAARVLQGNHTFWGGAVFMDFNQSASNKTIPPHVKYELRMDSSMVRSTNRYKQNFWYPSPMSDVFSYGQYITGGFVFLQDMLDQGIIKASLGKKDAGAGTYIQEMPYPCYTDDFFINTLGAALPLFMVLAWVFSVAMNIKDIVLEKELRLKEVMKVMGMGNAVHWVAWFLNSFAVMLVSSSLLVLVLKVGNIIINTDTSILLLTMVSFSFSSIALCFLISTFFSKANLAAACGAVIFFLTYIPYSMAYAWDSRLPLPAKFALSLSNTMAFGYSCQYLSLFETQSTGVQWGNINDMPQTSAESMTFLQVLAMMWVDTFIYMLLTWYIEGVFPGAYGIPRPFYFPFQRSYWCGSRTTDALDEEVLTSSNDLLTDNADFEAEPTHLKLGASICNLYKIYKTGKKLAVNNLSVNFYEGQITSFLGHNGAGKTTTMSILTGLFPPTAGTAYIYGKDILRDISRIRKSLGMCPQHNVLFDYLTVAEHLWFYARVKGATNQEIHIEMEEMLKHLRLQQKRNELVNNLSGGMKRKLSIAIAFVAGSKMVILDEPTAGVDPYARREIWELLGKYKEGRTIIMSTHHMDEADVLGDRIAIISAGQLRCSGSSLFLKGRFGNGYYLVLNKCIPGSDIPLSAQPIGDLAYNTALSKGPDVVTEAIMNRQEEDKKRGMDLDVVEPTEMKVALELEENDLQPKKAKPPIDIPDGGSCQESVVTRFIQSYLPSATLCENLGTELSYILPSSATEVGCLEFLFKELEMFKDQLYITNFGISDTSLEEVFLSVTDDIGVFNQGETTQGTDDGALPRPFMGRGSLKRRSYQLPAQSTSIKERRRRSVKVRRNQGVQPTESANGEAVLGDDEVDAKHGTAQEPAADTQNLDSINLEDAAESDCPGQEADNQPHGNHRQRSYKSSLKLNRQSSQQTSRPKMHRQISRQLSRQLIRQASREAVEIQQKNISVANVRMPDAATNEPRPRNLTGREVQGINLICRQFMALMIKRFHHFRRSKKGFFAQVILPVVFVCLAMVFTIIQPVTTEAQRLPLVPWLTGTPNYIFYSNDDPGSDLAVGMEMTIAEDDPGIGTRCMADNPFVEMRYLCEPDKATRWNSEEMDPNTYIKYLKGELKCECSGKGFEVCDPGAEGPPPPERVVPTTDFLQNHTSMEISWYLKTTTQEYVWKRFGGVSFLEKDEMAPLTLNISEDILTDWSGEWENPFDRDRRFAAPQATDDIPDDQDILPSDGTLKELYAVLLSLARFKNVKVWWDNTGFHALPAFINVANNMLFRGNFEESLREKYGITAYNHPINMTQDQIEEQVLKQTPIIMGTAIFIVFALAFVPASFVVFLIAERESKAKHLQIVSGISPTIYWVSTLVWDLVNYLIPAVLTIVIFLCFDQQAYISRQTAPATVLLLLMYGWAVTPMTYPISFIFTTPSTAYLSVACGTMLLGVLTIMTTFILEFLGGGDEAVQAVNDAIMQLFLIFPPFCLGRGLVDMSLNEMKNELYAEIGIESQPYNPLDWNNVGRNIFAMGIIGTGFFTLTLLIENRFFFKPRHIESEHIPLALEDDDVVRERQRVLSGGADNDIVRVENLTKDYNTSRGVFTAVDRMCVGIPYGECFGLLGVNGAGKTTTFKMLTGDTQVTSGSAYVKGFSILKDMKRVRQNIGYCPQFDALNELLTAEEHLAFYARLRGIPEADIKKVVQWGIKNLGLSMYAKRIAGTYSGGNKRKLSTAIALIGDPELIFLDEPTAGMDPKARRFLWNRITGIVKEGRSVILTSHSMEECEALCTRVAIMVNGRFKCIGSTQHLKSKFGDGYTISIRVGGDPPNMEPLMVFVAESFPYSILRERHFNMLEYQMPSTSASLAKVFGAFDANKQRFNIEDYSVSQTTLDQVFINFAKEQTAGIEDTQQAQGMEVTVINMPDGQLPDGNQVVVPPGMGTVQFLPENSTIGGFAFAAANIFGGVIHHDEQPGHSPAVPQSHSPAAYPGGGLPSALTRQDSQGFTNPLYLASPKEALNCGTNSPSAGGKTHWGAPRPAPDNEGKSDEEALDDCLVPKGPLVGQINDTIFKMANFEQALQGDTRIESSADLLVSEEYEETHL
ncbi:ATP-binding cassette sub-family A member 1-like [Acanthaster planci]|uniref:ATP-binding cassette sub-family A member 1-like n=1 Tax=Acanthaster planci TaxID=133434 RepID=A0A8B7ZXN3_ACAPL|nr:ATP-binding cassette sub-family A member 1-like [Acanthaster planci]